LAVEQTVKLRSLGVIVFSSNRASVSGRRWGAVGFAVLIAMAFSAAPARAFSATEGVAKSVDFDVILPCPMTSFGTFNCNLLNDPMPASAPLKISWGDGAMSSVTAVTDVTMCRTQPPGPDPLACDYTASVAHTYAEETTTTPYTVQATIMFNGSSHTDPGNSSATVADATPTVSNLGGTAVEGSTQAIALGQLSDSGGLSTTTYTVSIDWGDGSPADNLTGAVSSVGAVAGFHAYAQAGRYTAHVTITDDGGATAIAQAGVTVSDVAPALSPVSGLIATEGASSLLNVATFVDPGGSVMASNFTASIDWGDGTTSPGTVSASASPGGAFTVRALHTYGEEGTWPAKVTITDAGGAVSSVTTPVAVSDAGLTAAGGGMLHLQEGVSGAPAALATFGDADPGAAPGDFIATVDWGDGTASTNATVSFAGGGTFAVTGAHAYAEEGSYTPTVAIEDRGGATVSTAVASVIVVDQSLSATGIAILKATAGAPSGSLTVARFADGDPGATANDYAATINWGDASAPQAGTIATLPGGRFAVVGSHTYHARGTFHVQIRITDSGGAAASVTSTESVAPTRVQSTLVSQITFGPTFSRVTSLIAKSVPVGGQIRIGCNGTGCGRRALAIGVVAPKCKGARCHTATARTVDLAALVNGWRLAPGAQLTVEILKRGWIGKYYSFRIRSGAPPAMSVTCVAPGSRKAGVGC
jgi:hypothetical protein